MKLLVALPAVPMQAAGTEASPELVYDRVRIMSPGATETWNVLPLESPCKHVSPGVSLEPDTHACVYTHTLTHLCSHTCPTTAHPGVEVLCSHRIHTFATHFLKIGGGRAGITKNSQEF